MSALAPTSLYLPGLEGEERSAELEQYYTPPDLARKLWDWCPKPRTGRLDVLEPAAGSGSLIWPMLEGPIRPTRIVAYEIDLERAAVLASKLGERAGDIPFEVRVADFLTDTIPDRFDLALMNPPFKLAPDFIARCLELSRAVVSELPAGVEYSDDRWRNLWRWVDIRRKAALVDRPQHGGNHSPQTNFCAMDLQRRRTERRRGEPQTMTMEWW